MQVGALKPAEAEAPAAPPKEAEKVAISTAKFTTLPYKLEISHRDPLRRRISQEQEQNQATKSKKTTKT